MDHPLPLVHVLGAELEKLVEPQAVDRPLPTPPPHDPRPLLQRRSPKANSFQQLDIMEKKLSAGEWIEGPDGLGQVLAVNDLYWEEWQKPPEGVKPGDWELTMVTWKMLCTYKGKVKIQIKAANARLCNRIDAEQRKDVETLLREENVARKWQKCVIPGGFGNVHSFTFDMEVMEARVFIQKVETLGESCSEHLTYERICRRVPEFKSHLDDILPNVPANTKRLVVHLLNPMFQVDACNRRVLRFLSIGD